MRAYSLMFVLVAAGCAEAPADKERVDLVDTPAPISNDGKVWTFRANLPSDSWAELANQIATAERIEFLDPEQERLDWSILSDADALIVFRFDGQFERVDFESLVNCDKLKRLNLGNTNLTDEDLESLKRFSDLRSLRIGSPLMTDAVLETLASDWPRLTHLHLIRAAITDAGLSFLDSATTLESLYLDDVSVSNAALRALEERRPDLHLHVDQLHLDD